MKKNSNIEIGDILERNVEEVIDKENLRGKLLSGKKLRIKFGIDPTSPNIHIGRAVVLRKLAAFQKMGHKAILIVGDFTGLIGDTSDKESERPMLTETEVKRNLKTYFEQAFKILDKKKTETYYNSAWLKKLGFKEIGELANLFGLHEFEAREVISRRLKDGKRVSLREILYPLMQGYDSVAVKADVELGGTDQRFNLLAGRVIQEKYKQTPQDIMMTGLLEGTDGRKMSSSFGNVINLTDSPRDMFGKVMALADSLIEKYFSMATDLKREEIDETLKLKPIESKQRLAFELVKMYHNEREAKKEEEFFEKTFRQKELPEDIQEIKLNGKRLKDVLIEKNLVSSMAEYRRLMRAGAIEFEGSNVADPNFKPDRAGVLRIGKKKFIKII